LAAVEPVQSCVRLYDISTVPSGEYVAGVLNVPRPAAVAFAGATFLV
jgi:hypothetical protein